jgi:monomeric sarcosine oxidase
MPNEYDVIILGTGGVGSAAFYHAAKRGRRVLALEQFGAAHDRGSSHGQSRIIRQAYFEHPNYVPLLLEAYELWAELERATGKRLYSQTGLLEVGYPDGAVIGGIRQSAALHGLPIEEISDREFAQRFPQFRKGADQVAVFEPQAGYLLVEACVQAHIDAARALGGDFCPNTRIQGIRSNGDRVAVATERGEYKARHVIIAAGAWAAQLVPRLVAALRVVRKHQYWLPVSDTRFAAAAGAPTYFFETRDGFFYGFPVIDGGVAKVARHTGGEPIASPSSVDRAIDPNDLRLVQDFWRRHVDAPSADPARHAVCMYTMSPDEHFIVDRHPELPNAVYSAGLSGHGFKFVPILGKRLNDMLDGTPDERFDFLHSSRPAISSALGGKPDSPRESMA